MNNTLEPSSIDPSELMALEEAIAYLWDQPVEEALLPVCYYLVFGEQQLGPLPYEIAGNDPFAEAIVGLRKTAQNTFAPLHSAKELLAYFHGDKATFERCIAGVAEEMGITVEEYHRKEQAVMALVEQRLNNTLLMINTTRNDPRITL